MGPNNVTMNQIFIGQNLNRLFKVTQSILIFITEAKKTVLNDHIVRVSMNGSNVVIHLGPK